MDLNVLQVQNTLDASGLLHTSYQINIQTTPGSLLVCFVSEKFNLTDTFTITDSAGNVWTQSSSGYATNNTIGSLNKSGLFFVANSLDVDFIIVNFSTIGGIAFISVTVLEIGGGESARVEDTSVNTNNSSGSSISSGALSTSNVNDILVFAAAFDGSSTGWTAGSGFTIPNNNNSTGASGSNTSAVLSTAIEYKIVQSVQSSVSASLDAEVSSNSCGIFIALKGTSTSTKLLQGASDPVIQAVNSVSY